MSESNLIKCECGHPAYFHVSRHCEGDDKNGRCRCEKTQWDVIDAENAKLRELLGEMKAVCTLFYDVNKRWCCVMDGTYYYADTPQRAICEAWLKWKGIEI